MLHSNATKNHKIENWIYADDAARIAATGLVPADIGKIAFQTDAATYWRLTDDSPVTWVQVSGSEGGSSTPGVPWKYSTSNTEDDPSNGFFRSADDDGTATGFFYISIENGVEALWGAYINAQAVNNFIFLYPPGMAPGDTPGIYKITGAVVDNAGWYKIPVAFVDGFFDFSSLAANDLVNFAFNGPSA